MALEYINEEGNVTARTTGTFSRSDVNAEAEAIALVLAAGSNADEPSPTVGKAGDDGVVYAKLLAVHPDGDAFADPTIDSDGNITRGDIVTAATDGIFAFTKRADTSPWAIDDGEAGDIGKGILGAGAAGSGWVKVAATGGTGKIVNYDGTTIWVDFRS